MTVGYCAECEDTAASFSCPECDDLYCDLCFQAQHRSGSRLKHRKIPLATSNNAPDSPPRNTDTRKPLFLFAAAAVPSSPAITPAEVEGHIVYDDKVDMDNAEKNVNNVSDCRRMSTAMSEAPAEMSRDTQLLLQRAKFIPMRLSESERVLFDLLDAALNVSEYTDKVDILSYQSPVKRMVTELTDVFNIMSGMMVASDFRNGRKRILGQKYSDNAEFFQAVFEIGRRYKIMNPGMDTS
jgi:hypothetical protein